MTIQKIQEHDWNDILGIQSECYQAVGPEDLAILKNKWHASPDTCFVYRSEDEKIAGYLLAHPWAAQKPPKLFEPLPLILNCQTFYLHDMAVSSRARGLGIGLALLKRLIMVARQKKANRIRLVAVQGSKNFWAAQGFTEAGSIPLDPCYGTDATFMEKSLAE